MGVGTGDQVSKAAASEDEEMLSDEDDVESEDENLDVAMSTDVPDKDVETATAADGMFLRRCWCVVDLYLYDTTHLPCGYVSLSVCLSVCLSVTSWVCVKMAKLISVLFCTVASFIVSYAVL